MDERREATFERYAYNLIGAVLERLCVPFLLLDERARILFVSPMAEEILAKGAHIKRDVRERLMCLSPISAEAFGAFLEGLVEGVLETDLMIHAPGGSAPLYATLSPFEPPKHESFGELPPVAVVFIRDGYEEEAVEVARSQFGLTEAEVRMVRAVLTNTPIKRYAEQRAISVHTARKQLSTAMRKSGVNSQLQLQTLIAELTRGPKPN